jgi:ABC-2 type transport system permease protein
MLMFGLMLPFFLFLSFSIRRDVGAAEGIARLLAMTTFFTASTAGPVIIPLERRMGTYDRLLAAPMALVTLLVGKVLVGAFFGTLTSIVPLLLGLLLSDAAVPNPGPLLTAIVAASLAFSSLGLVFGSFPTRSVGRVMMPSTLVRWPLMFISGVFVPLEEMDPGLRAVSYISPLTYAQDLLNHGMLGRGLFNPWLDLALLLLTSILLLVPSLLMHRRSRQLGY